MKILPLIFISSIMYHVLEYTSYIINVPMVGDHALISYPKDLNKR